MSTNDNQSALGSENGEDGSIFSTSSGQSPRESDSIVSPILEDIVAPLTPLTDGDGEVQDETVIHARSYQVEMFDQSMKRNIIITMDTGSGKTQVAVLRIQAELERSQPGKIIWFLVPTVALCEQQFSVIQSQVPGVMIKTLTGAEGPETWSTTRVWDAFLDNVSIIVSTPQVLSDALLHGFLSMGRLSLIVFDEAHNCVGNHPGRKIMSHYWISKNANMPVPAILGLTASPIMKNSPASLEKLENTLDAVCKAPTKHRADLLAQVNRPVMECVLYAPVTEEDAAASSEAIKSVQHAYNGLSLLEDPFIQQKALRDTERSLQELESAIRGGSTPSSRQMKSLLRKTVNIGCELGSWAAGCYLHTASTHFLTAFGRGNVNDDSLSSAEKLYLAKILQSLSIPTPSPEIDMDVSVSNKASKLIEQLLACAENTVGIIFVKETATVNVLHQLLSTHLLIRHRFRLGTMVGTSRHALRKIRLGEVDHADSQLNLQKFRSGNLDILIATSVLEEGIDVPACNLVICFDKPSDLKSFIQRRGRARMKKSKLILMCDASSSAQNTWEEQEEYMRKQYEDENREKKLLRGLEESTEDYSPTFTTSVGTVMNLEDAKRHLDHFCAKLFSRQYFEYRPYYLFDKTDTGASDDQLTPPLIKATVVLPNSLSPRLRRTKSALSWYSEKNACKDAAFEAYRKLYEAGLVNKHLLPLEEDDLVDSPDTQLSEEIVCERWNPWPRVAKAWAGTSRYHYTVRLTEDQHVLCEFYMSIAVPLPTISPFKVFWDEKPWTVSIRKCVEKHSAPSCDAEETEALMNLALSHHCVKVKEGSRHVVLFHSIPGSVPGRISNHQLGSQSFSSETDSHSLTSYFIRATPNAAPYFFHARLPSRPTADLVQKKFSNFHEDYIEDADINSPWVALRQWPRRRDFLHQVRRQPPDKNLVKKPYHTAWPASSCRIDSTPIINVQFGSLIPSIMHVMEIHLVAQELSNELKTITFQDLSLVLNAISAPSARETGDYQRLEFLGDVILKFLSTVTVAVEFPHFPEAYLSKMRACIVSNARLCRATKETELDKYIITKEFTGHKWQPIYVDHAALLDEVAGTRQLPTTVLAAIVESLVGASYQDGGLGNAGMKKAVQCLRRMIPDVEWHSLEESRQALLYLREPMEELPSNMLAPEQLLGYTFSNKTLLLEALTHVSYDGNGSPAGRSYKRLEFIGDAIIDYIIVMELWERNLPPSRVSSLRTACVNADLLGFLGMEWTVPQTTFDIVDGEPVSSIVPFPFWKFMRHSSFEIGALQRVTAERHAIERESILEAIQKSLTYPWALLAQLHVPKFFSDIFQSIIGAVWLDSGGTTECTAIVRRIGILPYLERMLDQDIDIMHPKNKLGELAKQNSVMYDFGGREEDKMPLTCKVYVGEELIFEAKGGHSENEIVTRAAEEACQVLLARRAADTE